MKEHNEVEREEAQVERIIVAGLRADKHVNIAPGDLIRYVAPPGKIIPSSSGVYD